MALRIASLKHLYPDALAAPSARQWTARDAGVWPRVGARAVVENALRPEGSGAVTEGHIKKLKLIKRSVYGRANFDLLRKRVLRAA